MKLGEIVEVKIMSGKKKNEASKLSFQKLTLILSKWIVLLNNAQLSIEF